MPWIPAFSVALIFLGVSAFVLRDVRRHPVFASATSLALLTVGALSIRQEVLQDDAMVRVG